MKFSFKKRFIYLVFSILPFSSQSFLPPYSLFGQVLNNIKTDKKVVALSFDDGPNKVYTHEVLAILRENNIKGTFFLNGRNISGNELLVRQMQVEGHSVGNHSYTHSRINLLLPMSIEFEVEETQKAIEEVIGQRTHLFRAPYGLYNSPFLMSYLQKKNYTVIGWSVDPKDWAQKDPQKVIDAVLDQVRPGAIILLHDGPEDRSGVVDRTPMIKALPIIIETLKSKGYKFETIPELILEQEVLGVKTNKSPSSVILNLFTLRIIERIQNLFK